jgi:hypothetical protein
MTSKTPALGDPIQSRCSKCRKITPHTVVALTDDQPAEVQCNTCQHTSAARKPVDRRVTDPKKAAREEWASLRPGMDSSRAADYSMTGAYKAKSLVNHPVFGLGLVQRQAGLQKMLVLFADGEKVMRCK